MIPVQLAEADWMCAHVTTCGDVCHVPATTLERWRRIEAQWLAVQGEMFEAMRRAAPANNLLRQVRHLERNAP